MPGISIYLKSISGHVLLNTGGIWTDRGRKIDVQCKKTGAPLPHLTWYHNGQAISSMESKHRCLIINKASQSDAGRYTAIAQNSEGATQTYFELHVKGKKNSDSFVTETKGQSDGVLLS